MHIFWCGFRRKFDEILNFTIPKFKMSNSVTNVSQKSKNVEFYQILIIFYHIRPIFRILTAVKTRNLPGKWIFFDLVFAGRPERQQYTFWTWDDTTHGHRFSKKCQKLHFLGLLAIFLKFRSFRKKSGRVSFHHLWSPNLMQKIRNILQLDFQILNHLKWRTDRAGSRFFLGCVLN